MDSSLKDKDHVEKTENVSEQREMNQLDQLYDKNNEINFQEFNMKSNNVSENQIIDIHQSNDSNEFAMDVNLNSFEGFSQTEEQQVASKEMSTQEQQQQDRRSFRIRSVRTTGGEEEDEKDILNKIFVGGIHPDTTEESLKEHFSKFGTIVDHVIIKDPATKRSRGFGFVKYSESSAVDEVMKNRPHAIDNKKLDVKRSTPRKDAIKTESSANVNKLFVGGLDESILEEDLREYFLKFGNITEIVIKSPKEGVRVRAFAFITFDDYDPVDKVIITKNHTIKSLKLTVRKGYVEQTGGKFNSAMNGQFQYGQHQFHHGGRSGRNGTNMQGASSLGRNGVSRGRGRVMGAGGFNMGFGGGYVEDGTLANTGSYYGAYNSQEMVGANSGGKMMGGSMQNGPMRRSYQKRSSNQATFTPY